MTKLKLLTIALAATMLTACEKREVFGERRVTMEVVSVYLTTKSNSRVNLREVNTGYVWKDQSLSCSRERAAKVKIGSKWDVTEMTYVYPESKRYSTALVGTSAICTKSN